MKKFLSLMLVALLAGGCDKPSSPKAELPILTGHGEGQNFIRELAAEIGQADRIVVTEHSDEGDVYDEQKRQSLIPQQVIYATRELTSAQRTAFQNLVIHMDPETMDAEKACIFAPHHTVTFYKAGRESIPLKICFQCDEVQWKSGPTSWPRGAVPAFETTITALGLHPHGDWYALAEAQAKRK